MGLGAFKDSPELHETAARYLRGFRRAGARLTDKQKAAVKARIYRHNPRLPWLVDLWPFGMGRKFFRTLEDANLFLQREFAPAARPHPLAALPKS